MKLQLIRCFFLLTAGAAFLNGCSEEQLLADDAGGYGREMTALTLTTHLPQAFDNGTSAEDDVQTLRLLVYEYNGTSYLSQKANAYYTAAEASAGNGTYQMRIEVPHGIAIRVFVVANEKAQWNLGDPAMSATALRNKVIDPLEAGATLDMQPPFVMFNESGTIESSDYRAQDLPLVRTIAKVSLSVQALFDQIVGLNGGEISLTNATLKRLPKTQKLAPGFSYTANDESDFSLTTTKAFTLTPVVDGQNRVTGFTTEAARKLLFYVPEYLLSHKAYYSFLQINGQYTPLGSSSSLPITYRIPVGDGVQKLYEASGAASVDQLLTDDLSITRNTHYDFEATLQTLGQSDGLQLYVQAQPWVEGETVEGASPGAPYLNVSNIDLTLTGTTLKRLYFWTNQPVNTVGIMPTLKDAGDVSRTLDDLFHVTLHFTNTLQTNGSVEIRALANTPSGTYTIYLNAGGLMRSIRVQV